MTPADPVTFPADIADFLAELAAAMNRRGLYPEGHPTLRPAMEAVAGRLNDLLERREPLHVAVRPQTLVWEGIHSSTRNTLLTALAARLHEHEVGGLIFRTGIGPEEVAGLVDAVADEVDAESPPLGAVVRSEGQRWPHLGVEALHFDELTLRGSRREVADRVEALWAALVVETLGPGTSPGDPEVASRVAVALAGAADPEAWSRFAGRFAHVVEELGNVDTAVLPELRSGVSDVLRALDPEARARLMESGEGGPGGRRLLDSAWRSLDVRAVLDLLDSAARSSGQTISTSMTRLLVKLATQGGGPDPSGETDGPVTVGEDVRELLRDWVLDDPNPDEYTQDLDAFSRGSELRPVRAAKVDDADAAARILAMGLEMEEFTPRSEDALLSLLDAGGLPRLFALVDAVPDSEACTGILDRLRSPAMVRRAVACGGLDPAALDRLARWAGREAVPALLDGLGAATSRYDRRAIFDALVGFGAALIPEIRARIPSPYWFVDRNMLNLLEVVPGDHGVDVLPFLEHPDPRVRRAALPVALRNPQIAEAALVRALSDRDERLVQRAVQACEGHATPEVLRTLTTRVALARRTPELREMAVRGLRGHRVPGVRDALLILERAPAEDARTARIVAAAREVLDADWPDDDKVRTARRRRAGGGGAR